jgi:hypothetical protein
MSQDRVKPGWFPRRRTRTGGDTEPGKEVCGICLKRPEWRYGEPCRVCMDSYGIKPLEGRRR